MKRIEWLKQKIWPVHKQFEEVSKFSKLLRSDLITSTDYRIFISTLYPVVLLVDEIFEKEWRENFQFASDLKKELDLFKSENEKTVLNIHFVGKYAALGAMYTIQGSMKGGEVIVNRLSSKPEFFNHTFYYYRTRDDVKEWIENRINLAELNAEEETELVNGAREVFTQLMKLDL